MIAKSTLSIALAALCGCTSIPDPNKLEETAFIETIINNCDLLTTIDGCTELSKKQVKLKGVFWFPTADKYAPRIYPAGTDASIDDFFSNDHPPYLDFKITDLSKTKRELLVRYHNVPVLIDAKTNTDCVIGNAGVLSQPIDTDEIYFLTGYCHTQGDVYLTDFFIEEL